ncbi:MAG: hypothetical protein EAZ89_01055 [Bacteroidetes bacterium]|nr:MAG: hypothetical protein EAZ89_01055 [Bacteroidota bacterium]
MCAGSSRGRDKTTNRRIRIQGTGFRGQGSGDREQFTGRQTQKTERLLGRSKRTYTFMPILPL